MGSRNKVKTGGVVLLIVCFMFILSGCGPRQDMDQPSDDGNFYYQNRDLDFHVTLPPEFEYYQTQRLEEEGYIDIVFLVPTSDASAFDQVEGYTNPLTVRVHNREEGYADFQRFGEKRGKYYAFNFWEQPSRDWEDKWDRETEESIKESLKVK